jgi:hypothetical protein
LPTAGRFRISGRFVFRSSGRYGPIAERRSEEYDDDHNDADGQATKKHTAQLILPIAASMVGEGG